MKPFNLAAALAGEPISFKGYKSYVHCSKGEKNTYIIECTTSNRVWFPVDITELSECTMWEEPQPRVTLTLPAPLKEPRDEMWYIDHTWQVSKSVYNSNLDKKTFELRFYFGSRGDAKEWLNALYDSRR